MNTTNAQVSLFVKLALAIIKGDDAQAIAIKIQRSAIAALTAQIAAKVYHTLVLEDELEKTEEAFISARVNGGEKIIDTSLYIRNLLTARRNKTLALEALDYHKEEIKFLEEELEIAKK